MKLHHLLPALLLAALPLAHTQAAVDVSITVAPPVLPVYAQPLCPKAGYLWTPGYWAYDFNDYYWVPGAWVLPPRVGFLWTPGYWGYNDGFYTFNSGYWGPRVGFYGGVNYGFGYGGYGYYGGRWDGGVFRYNTAVTRVNTTIIHNTYVDKTVINNNTTHSRASFNGLGGVNARPDARQLAAAHAPHLAPTALQGGRRTAALGHSTVHPINHAAPVARGARPSAAHGQRMARQPVSSRRVAQHPRFVSRPPVMSRQPRGGVRPAKVQHAQRRPQPNNHKHS